MRFQCKICVDLFFESNEQAIQHLKTNHKIKNGADSIECTVKNSNCGKFFQTFQGLSRHTAKCVSDIAIVSNIVNDSNQCFNENITVFNNNQTLTFNECDIDSESCEMITEKPLYNDDIIYDSSIENDDDHKYKLGSSFVFDSNEVDVQNANQIARNFLMGLLTLDINEKTLNDVFRLTEMLIEKTHLFCQQSIKSKDKALEAVDCSFNLVSKNLKELNSTFKRTRFIENQKSFIKPDQIGIGTHWVNERDKDSRIQVPAHKQSLFKFISPCKKIKSLFELPHFRDIYFNYNQSTKHECHPNVYKDFCCGKLYQESEFFKKNPCAIQLQFFFDGFEITNPLKSKTTLHSQVAVYMTIRNMPFRFAYNMDNIFTICLVNENDLKKAETDYTNILEQIVKDVHVLETTGIDLASGINLKGNQLGHFESFH